MGGVEMAKGKRQKTGKKSKKVKFQEPFKREKISRLASMYKDSIKKKMQDEFGYKNVMQIPKLTKIVVNASVGEAMKNPKLLESAFNEIKIITGRKPVICKAKKSIAAFKLREGMKIGTKVTLRKEYMYEFFDRLVSFALPRTRDFKGISEKGFDGRGNYTLGVTEQIIFPEISIEKIKNITGMDITFVTSAKDNQQGYELLKALGLPFVKANKQN